MTRKHLTACLLTLLAAAPPSPAELSTEQRLEAALREAGDTRGTVVELTATGNTFLAIHWPHQRGENRGAVVLLHDQGGSADSLDVIRPLRLGLAESGWDTLSLQLPFAYRHEAAAAWQARSELIQARLQAAFDWLRGRNLRNQVVVAHGASGAIALEFAADGAPRELRALVLVSATHDPAANAADSRPWPTPDRPLLDIFAERDTPTVMDSAAARKAAADAAGASRFRQLSVPGALPGFRATADGLLTRVRAWLAANAAAGP